MTAPSPQELRKRIEDVYLEITRSPSKTGALSWFAEQAHVRRQTVDRWVNGHRTPQGPTVGLLEALEREAGIR